jgi:3'-5' exoribonuclease
MIDSDDKVKKIFVADLKTKDQVSSEFLVKYMALMEGRDGRSYLNLVLADSTGEIEARVWSDANRLAQLFKKGQIVSVKGKVNLYQGRRQLVVSEIFLPESQESFDMQLFYPSSEQKPDEMYQQLMDAVEGLEDVYLKALLESILVDPEISRRLKIWPAGKTIHHAYQSGLLEHILSCTKLALHLSDYYHVNKNLIVEVAIINDLCNQNSFQ